MIKKTILAGVVMATFATSGLANMDSFKNTSLQLGSSAIDLESSDDMGYGYNVGLEYDLYKGEKVDFSWGINLQGISEKEFDYTSTDLYVSIGYKINEKMKPYLILGAAGLQTDDADFMGIEYGLGFKYQLIDYVAIDTKVITSTVSESSSGLLELDISKVLLNLEFNFNSSE